MGLLILFVFGLEDVLGCCFVLLCFDECVEVEVDGVDVVYDFVVGFVVEVVD